jgi:hypothetical protein
MIWNREQWALAVSYRGHDPQLDMVVHAIAAQHGGKPRRVGVEQPYRGLGFNFSTRVAAEAARTEIMSFRPGVLSATNLQPES